MLLRVGEREPARRARLEGRWSELGERMTDAAVEESRGSTRRSPSSDVAHDALARALGVAASSCTRRRAAARRSSPARLHESKTRHAPFSRRDATHRRRASPFASSARASTQRYARRSPGPSAHAPRLGRLGRAREPREPVACRAARASRGASASVVSGDATRAVAAPSELHLHDAAIGEQLAGARAARPRPTRRAPLPPPPSATRRRRQRLVGLLDDRALATSAAPSMRAISSDASHRAQRRRRVALAPASAPLAARTTRRTTLPRAIRGEGGGSSPSAGPRRSTLSDARSSDARTTLASRRVPSRLHDADESVAAITPSPATTSSPGTARRAPSTRHRGSTRRRPTRARASAAPRAPPRRRRGALALLAALHAASALSATRARGRERRARISAARRTRRAASSRSRKPSITSSASS